MRPDPIETVGWTAFFVGLFVGCVLMMVIYETSLPKCLEDEVLVQATEQCVPLDDITEAAVDLYMEAVNQPPLGG